MIQYPMQRIGITAGFGPYTIAGVRKPHNGCDICAQRDRTVRAAHDGRVIFSTFDAAGGHMVAVQGAFNDRCEVLTRYAHLAARSVRAGEQVARGQAIGTQGETGSACFGRHLHFETWLVPKGYVYRYSDRARYSVDPLSVCHLVTGQSFVRDADTGWKDGIPYPEPAPQALRALAGGARVTVQNGAVRVRLVPWTAYPPLVSGSADRAKDTLAEWWAQESFPALYTCVTRENDTEQRWAMIDTPYGTWWVALLDGYTALTGEGEVPEDVTKPATPGETDDVAEGPDGTGGGTESTAPGGEKGETDDAAEGPDGTDGGTESTAPGGGMPACDAALIDEVGRLGRELVRAVSILARQQALLVKTAELWSQETDAADEKGES